MQSPHNVSETTILLHHEVAQSSYLRAPLIKQDDNYNKPNTQYTGEISQFGPEFVIFTFAKQIHKN